MKSNKQTKTEFSPDKLEREIEPILGVSVSSKGYQGVLEEAYRLVEASMTRGSQARNSLKIIVTPNPEIVYRASLDNNYRDVLNKADLSMADGIGLVWARNFLNLNVPDTSNPLLLFVEALACGWDTWANRKDEVVPGRLIFEELVGKASERKWKVFLLGGTKDVAIQAQEVLKNRYKDLKIESSAGPWLTDKAEPRDKEQFQIEKDTIEKINNFSPDLLFVAFGPPKQELWLNKNKSKLNAKVGMVVGGTFDYVGGKVPKPPKFIKDNNLEWAWRLVTQPQRVGRIYTAVVKFPFKVFQEKLDTKRSG